MLCLHKSTVPYSGLLCLTFTLAVSQHIMILSLDVVWNSLSFHYHSVTYIAVAHCWHSVFISITVFHFLPITFMHGSYVTAWDPEEYLQISVNPLVEDK